jgi:dienelactone hydrolase
MSLFHTQAGVSSFSSSVKNVCRQLVVGVTLIAGLSAVQAQTLDATLNERVVMVPARVGKTQIPLETTLYTPPGEGPFPLVIMNHGKERGSPAEQKRDRFLSMSREFVKRGYAVVVPMRQGFSKSGGKYVEINCDMTSNGNIQADSLQGTLEYFSNQSWVDKDRILVAGQSYGGLATMAFGARNFPGVKGLINFAGGLKYHGGSCPWEASLETAFADFGAKSQLPSLWFYGENDSHFAHPLANRLHQAYTANGGLAKLVAFGAFKRDAHGLVGSRDGVSIWWPETEAFLRQLGMPTDVTVALAEPQRPARTDYAAIDNVEAVPFVRQNGRDAYRTFLTKSLPRAFAVGSNGAWSWAEEGDDPAARALSACVRDSGQACKLYAVDDYVVWSNQAATPVLAATPQAATAGQ